MTSDHDDDQDGGFQQRVISAAEAEPFRAPGASSVFNWRGPGTEPGAAGTGTTAAGAAQSPEEEAMARRKGRREGGAARARKTEGGSPQFQICAVLLAHGDLSRNDLHAKLDGVTAPQLASALNNAKTRGRVELSPHNKFHLTKTGQAWVTGGANLKHQQAPEREPSRNGTAQGGGHERAKPEQEVDTSPPQQEKESDFRCAVMSDGCFWLRKGGVEIELTVDEHRQMLAYQERMAVEA